MSKSRSRLAADWFARLRLNATTQEVEHEDVVDVETDLDNTESVINTTVNTQLLTLQTQLNNISVTPTDVSEQSNTATGAFDVPAGTTAQRPSNPNTGFVRFNTQLNFLEQYTTDGWVGISAPPSVTSVDNTNIAESGTQTIVITGQRFDATASAVLVDGNSVVLSPTSSTRNSSSQITIVYSGADIIPDSAAQPLSVKVTNGSGLSASLDGAIQVNGKPVWSTTAGSLGSVYERQSVSKSVSASDPDGDTVSYSIVSGGLPSGVSLNSSTGAITGTAPAVSGNVTNNFTIRASDGQGNTADRAFSLGTLQTVITWNTGTSLSGATQSSSYSTNLSASSNVGSVSYSVVSGSVPSGMSVNSSGTLSGSPSATGSYSFTVRATANGDSADRTFSISVSPPKYRYWRIQINRGGGQIQTTEVSLVHANGTWLGGGNGYTGAQSMNGPSNAVYNGQANSSEHWNFASGSYIYFDFGSPGYAFGSTGVGKIRSGGSDDSGRYISNVVVQASTNNSSWITMYNGSPGPFAHNSYTDKVIY
jgi:hypothetical protein